MGNNVFEELISNEVRMSLPEQRPEDRKRAEEHKRNNSESEGVVRIIALDESGRFEEKISNTNKYVFVGGVVKDIPYFDGKVSEAVDEYKKTIIDKFEDICNKFNIKPENRLWDVKVPCSLHANLGSIKLYQKNTNNEVDATQGNAYKCKERFLKHLRREVKNFLKSEGFKTFVYLRPEQIDLPGVEKSNVSDVSVGANLYEDMLITSVENLLFYDTSVDVHNASIQMAKRSLGNNVLDESVADELYESRKKDDGKKIYYITDTNLIRTALMHKIRYGKIKNKDMHLAFYVDSINYDLNGCQSEEDRNNRIIEQAFLYLADMVCSAIRTDLYEKSREDDTLTLGDIAKSFDIEEYDIRMYSGSDKYYRDMVDSINFVELAEYYSLKYDFEKKVKKNKDNYTFDYYAEGLINELDSIIINKIKSESSYRDKVINSIPHYYSVANGLMGMIENNYEKGMSIAKNILKVINEIDSLGRKGFKNSIYRDKYIFRFNDIIVRGHNHRGDIKKTDEYILVCEEKSYAVGIEEYLEHRQRAVQKYFNSMDYDFITKEYLKGLVGEYNGTYWDFSKIEKLKDALTGLSGLKNEGEYLLAGKIYSTMAQAMAFKRSQQAEYYFEKALLEMKSDAGNLDITYSYLLHYYIDMGAVGDRDKYISNYEKIATDYFEVQYRDSLAETLNKQFNIIINNIEEIPEYRFALYVYLKAFKVFYINDARLLLEDRNRIIERILRNLKVESIIKDDLYHPWQLIYKNVFEIVKMTIDDKKAKEYMFDKVVMEKRMEIEGPTIAAMLVDFKLDYMKEIKGKIMISDSELEKIRELPDFENETIETIYGDKVRNKLKEKLTYMYN